MASISSQQIKSYLKTIGKASVILGIMSVIINGGGYIYIYGYDDWSDYLLIISSFSIPLIGLFFGIIGLKFEKKISIAGIIFSLIGLFIAIFFFLILLGFQIEG